MTSTSRSISATRLIVFTARPGRIKADIRIPDIDRSGEFRKSQEYLALRVQVWDLLREEVLKARALEESVRINSAADPELDRSGRGAGGLGGLRPAWTCCRAIFRCRR